MRKKKIVRDKNVVGPAAQTGQFITQAITNPEKRDPKTRAVRSSQFSVKEAKEWVDEIEK